jgi:hypothetical protein
VTRTLCLSLFAVATLLAAPVPKKPAKDYQKLADETEWQFDDLASFDDRLATELGAFKMKVKDLGGKVSVVISSSNWEKPVGWETRTTSPFAHRNGVLYSTDVHPRVAGCSVTALDLRTNRRLWSTDLKGVGLVDHTKYRNEVRMEVLDGDTLRVFGKESSGRYVEIVDRHSGKTVGHKVFDETK